METCNFNMNIAPIQKAKLESVYGRIGLSLSEAVSVFFEQSLLADGLPFTVEQPLYNKKTEAAMQEARDIMSGKKNAKRYYSAKEMFDDLDAEEC